MTLSTRQTEILARIRQNGRVLVDDLAESYGVTTQTVRRDLNEMSNRGLIARTHGGATQSHSVTNVRYEDRRKIGQEAKRRIGQAAAALIPEHCSVMLNIGTTTEQVARHLIGHRNLVVITNNINVITILSGSPDKDLILAGGTVRQSDGAIVGDGATEFISRFKADYAVIGASVLDADGAVLDYDSREVSVAHAILRNARTRILVADQSKFDHNAPVRICAAAELDMFITDLPPPISFRDACAQGNTRVIVAADEGPLT